MHLYYSKPFIYLPPSPRGLHMDYRYRLGLLDNSSTSTGITEGHLARATAWLVPALLLFIFILRMLDSSSICD